jgi:integrase
MSNVRYYLDRDNIFLTYYAGPGDRVKFSISEKIKPEFWDRRKQRARITCPGAADLNYLLDQLQDFIIKSRREAKTLGRVFDGPEIKKLLKYRLHGDPKTIFKDYSQTWLNDRSGAVKIRVYRSYFSACKRVWDGLPGLRLDEINRTACGDLLKKWLADGYTQNTINYTLSVLRMVIMAAAADGLTVNKYYLKRGFVPPAAAVDSIYLTLADLDRLFNLLDQEPPEYIKNALVPFLAGCLTGQRWQTYTKLNKKMVFYTAGQGFINIRQEKTGVNVSIPVTDRLLWLLDQETAGLKQAVTIKYLREAGKLAGLLNYGQIGTHTARRTFATNMVLAGVDIYKIMAITGHKTEKEFRKYVKMEQLQAAAAAAPDVRAVFG